MTTASTGMQSTGTDSTRHGQRGPGQRESPDRG